MKITTAVRNDVAIVSVEGEIQFGTALGLRTAMNEVIATTLAKRIELDLAHVSYLDSSGLGVLLTSRDLARKSDKELILTNCRGGVRDVLTVARFDRLFSINP